VALAKQRWIIERDYEELKQEQAVTGRETANAAAQRVVRAGR
jgi:hypothetical protein